MHRSTDHSFANSTLPSSSSSALPTNWVDDIFGYRLFLLALTLSAVAICACAILIPVLITELDELAEFAQREEKIFKAITDSIWHDLMALQGRRSSIGQSHSPWAVVVPLRKHRPSRSLQAGPSESNSFLDRLERKSFKGRQRLKNHPDNFLAAQHAVPIHSAAVPRARSWTFTNAKYEDSATERHTTMGTTRRPLPAAEGGSAAIASNRCPKGPPGNPGLPGIDGVPGENGTPGKPGLSGDEVQASFGPNQKCIKCPAGLPGARGLPGVQGVRGENGIAGVPGTARTKELPGPAGPVGEPGIPGADGSDGVPGFPGVPGIRYSKGPAGTKGPIGAAGEAGLPGVNGPDGEPGRPGEPGWRGWPGTAGVDGRQGNFGPPGPQGIPGVEKHYCNCPVRTSQLMKLKDQPGGVDAYLGRWKGRVPLQLLEDYEQYVKEKELELKLKPPLLEVQN